MIHNVHFVIDRFPERAPRIVSSLIILSASALMLGIGLLIQ
ncbi:MAG TPA: hypothetical protein VF190_13805 [Rhodothermales bacterium]